MNNTQTWRIEGQVMNYTQLMAWKKKKEDAKNRVDVKEHNVPSVEPVEVEKPEKEVEVADELKDEGYDARNSVEKEYDALKEKGWKNLDGGERKKYSSHKKQLGK